jgi:hypothetical protein
MGLAFELAILPSRRALWLSVFARLLAATGLGFTAIQVGAGPTALMDAAPGLHGAAAASFAVVALLLLVDALRVLRALPSGRAGVPADRLPTERLRVDEEGACELHSPVRGGVPATLVQVCILPGLILVTLAPSAVGSAFGRHWRYRTLSLGRDTMASESWRSLNAWLLWCSRGRRDGPSGWKRR